jgi:hypothetical protein
MTALQGLNPGLIPGEESLNKMRYDQNSEYGQQYLEGAPSPAQARKSTCFLSRLFALIFLNARAALNTHLRPVLIRARCRPGSQRRRF